MTDFSVSPRHARALLLIALLSYFMIVLDASIVITGLPHIRDSLGFGEAGLSWVQNAYLLAFGGLLLLGARAGDLFGRRRMLMVGLSLFTVASVAIGAALSPAWLVLGRALQGAGAAVLAPATLALLTSTFPEGPGRTRALGLHGATAGISASLGLVVGGLLADLLSWRVGFFINLPVGVALILAVRRHLPQVPDASSTARADGTGNHAVVLPTERGRDGESGLDLPGASMSTMGMVGLVYAIVRGAEGAGWRDPVALGLLTGALALLAVFLRREARVQRPLLPLHLFADRGRAGAYAARFFFLGGMMGFWFFTTQYLQGVRGMSAVQAGAAYLPATLTNFAAAMAVPRLTRRFGLRAVLTTGLSLSVAGVAWLAHLDTGSSYRLGVALPMLLIGVGQGLSLSPLTVAGVAGVAPAEVGAASGVVNVVHQLGGSIGLAVLVAVSSAAGAAAPPVHRFSIAFTAAATLLGLALLAVLATQRREAAASTDVVGDSPHPASTAAPGPR